MDKIEIFISQNCSFIYGLIFVLITLKIAIINL